MNAKSWTGVAAVLLSGAAAALFAVAPAFAQNRWGADYFPNVLLTTQDGTAVRFYDDLLKGKAVAINLIYTSCTDECPLETARLVQVQRLLGERVGKDVFFYSISIDPGHDTPEVLKAYAQKFGVGPGWLFLTGNEEEIKLIARKLGLARNNDAANRDRHTAVLMLGDVPGGQWMRNSAVDNPRFLATTMTNFFGWKTPPSGKSYEEARPLSLDRGTYLFDSQCSACHTVGAGDRIGPDLAGVTLRRDRVWLSSYVQAPEKMLAAGDPTATALFNQYKGVRMPNLNLAPKDVSALLDYLEAKSLSLPQKAHDHSAHHH